jgi:hypothetical protein
VGCDRFTAATQELRVATAPNHPPSLRVAEEERRSGEGTQYQSVGAEWSAMDGVELQGPPARSSRTSQWEGGISISRLVSVALAPTTSSRLLQSADGYDLRNCRSDRKKTSRRKETRFRPVPAVAEAKEGSFTRRPSNQHCESPLFLHDPISKKSGLSPINLIGFPF